MAVKGQRALSAHEHARCKMVLGTAEEAALIATFAKKRGRFSLTSKVQRALVTFLKQEDRVASELPLDVPEADAEAESIKEEWDDLAKDAGLTLQSDVNGLRRWALAGRGGDSTGPGARAGAVLDLLSERGVNLSSSVAAELEDTLRTVGESGDVASQSKCSLCVCILYTCELPGAEIVAWHEACAKALTGMVGKVDLRGCDVYIKLHKNTSKTTLERALLDKDPSNRKLSVVKRLINQALYTASLPLAATQFQLVTGWAAEHFRHDPQKEKVYLWGYFFSSFTGLGLPEERDRDTLIDMQAPTPGGVSSVEAEMRPTIPSEANASAWMGGQQITPDQLALPSGMALPSGLPASVIALLQAQQKQIAQLQMALEALGARRTDGPLIEDPPIRELPSPKAPVQKCAFCHLEHDLTVKCPAMKQGLRLKADWDKEQAKVRRAAEAAAAAAGAAPP